MDAASPLCPMPPHRSHNRGGKEQQSVSSYLGRRTVVLFPECPFMPIYTVKLSELMGDQMHAVEERVGLVIGLIFSVAGKKRHTVEVWDVLFIWSFH